MPTGGLEEIQFPSRSEVPAYRNPRCPFDSTGASRARGFLGSSVRSDAHSTPDRGTTGRQGVAISPHPLDRDQERSRRDRPLHLGFGRPGVFRAPRI